ncbi:MAG: hypothetical protein WC775_05995 [Patescibacteria group bacterium]|jgi:hypothetical protein
MIVVFVGIFTCSLILAAFSMRDYKGSERVQKITEELHKARIKGTIILPQNGEKRGTHYSSYS